MTVEDVIAFIKERKANLDNLHIAISREMQENNDHETIVYWALNNSWNDFNNELRKIQEELGDEFRD